MLAFLYTVELRILVFTTGDTSPEKIFPMLLTYVDDQLHDQNTKLMKESCLLLETLDKAKTRLRKMLSAPESACVLAEYEDNHYTDLHVLGN